MKDNREMRKERKRKRGGIGESILGKHSSCVYGQKMLGATKPSSLPSLPAPHLKSKCLFLRKNDSMVLMTGVNINPVEISTL